MATAILNRENGFYRALPQPEIPPSSTPLQAVAYRTRVAHFFDGTSATVVGFYYAENPGQSLVILERRILTMVPRVCRIGYDAVARWENFYFRLAYRG